MRPIIEPYSPRRESPLVSWAVAVIVVALAAGVGRIVLQLLQWLQSKGMA